MSYIQTADVTASIAIGFDLEPYIEEADSEIDDLAERLGVRDTADIETNPLHYKIKRYAIAYILMRLCQDKAGTNNVDAIESDKYAALYSMYRQEVETARPQISVEMYTGTVNSTRDRATSSGALYRG